MANESENKIRKQNRDSVTSSSDLHSSSENVILAEPQLETHASDPMHSPPIQVIQREKEEQHQYDPGRIPTSVFARSDTLTPAEWSAVSSESLFSLHGTHPSMCREHDFLLTEEVKRLTQLSKSGELSSEDFKGLRKLVGMSREALKFNPPLPTTSEEAGEDRAVTKSEDKREVAPDEPKIETPTTAPVRRDEVKIHIRSLSSSSSKGGDERGRSTSFAFPVLANGGNAEGNKGQNHQQQNLEQKEESPISSLEDPAPQTCNFLSYFPCLSCCSGFFPKCC